MMAGPASRCRISAIRSWASGVLPYSGHGPVVSPIPRWSRVTTRNPARTSSGTRNLSSERRSSMAGVQTISGPSPVSSYAIRPPGTSRNFVTGMTAGLLGGKGLL